MPSAVTIYVVHHPDSQESTQLSKQLFDWFRLGHTSGKQSEAGLPVYFRRQLNSKNQLEPEIRTEAARLNVIVLLVDRHIIASQNWAAAVEALVEKAVKADERGLSREKGEILLLPVALEDCFYRAGTLYAACNPIRLIEVPQNKRSAVLRRLVTEAIARQFRTTDHYSEQKPLQVFLSHAKKDGRGIAERLRDTLSNFGQLEPWYDANDLPYGKTWKRRMTSAVAKGTAAMIATVSDVYSTRPWCREEAELARTPVKVQDAQAEVWKVQPVVAVIHLESTWSRAMASLEGVPRIGWQENEDNSLIELIVDRLLLEVLLSLAHQKIAADLRKNDLAKLQKKSLYITWAPDLFTLSKLRQKVAEIDRTLPAKIRRIVFPGFGLTQSEEHDLQPILQTFHRETRLVGFEEAMS